MIFWSNFHSLNRGTYNARVIIVGNGHGHPSSNQTGIEKTHI